MKDISFYQFEQGGQFYAYAKDQLAAVQVDTDQTDDQGKTVQTSLDTPQKVAQAFPGGQWHTVTLIDALQGRHKLQIEEMCWVRNAQGIREYDPVRRALAMAVVCVKDWTFDKSVYPVSTADEREQSLMELDEPLPELIQDQVYYQVEGRRGPNPTKIAMSELATT